MRIALAQMSSGFDVEQNIAQVRVEVAAAAEAGAELVVLPEATMHAFGAPLAEPAYRWAAAFREEILDLARRHEIAVVAGLFAPSDDEARVRNELLLATADGRSHSYRKLHLFDAFGHRESDTVESGAERVIAEVGNARVAMAICYDVRFSSLFVQNAADGAAVSLVCASWAEGPGKVDQWRLLAQARALDSTTFVLACGQADPATVGTAANGAPRGVGHSLIVSPRGTVLAELDGAPGRLVMDIDLAEVDQARKDIPVVANSRPMATLPLSV